MSDYPEALPVVSNDYVVLICIAVALVVALAVVVSVHLFKPKK